MNDPRTCPHDRTEPVDVRSRATGQTETVARICTYCLAQLPVAWGCAECSWVDVATVSDPAPVLVLGQPCREHVRG